MGFSVDNGGVAVDSVSPGLSNDTIDILLVAGAGDHTIQVYQWNSQNDQCEASVSFTVLPSVSPPVTAVAINNVQARAWEWHHDPATGATSTGTSELVSSPFVTLGDTSREFDVSFTSNGGELFSSTIGKDTVATHFIYDIWVYIPNPSALANVEMDMNQVMANGETVIYGFQCDGWSGTWDYTSESPSGHWVHSQYPCNPRTWSNEWHHVQIQYERDATGIVTYQAVVFDGQQNDLNETVVSAEPLGWTVGTLLVNFQLDGKGSGAVTAYVDDLTIYRW